ncbi:MAG: NAD(P)/FAD-dependent oxidoreductase [Actinobacteria bacterium]|nr:NAD(P)/FAD-dependent oxidoreductase [Actinomycetota bacterium]
MEKWDVVVVGGGPGGSYAAKTAAEAGLKTVFFERGRKPGDKNSSGCGLGQRWWKDYPELMEELQKLPSVRKVEMVVINLIDEHDRLRYRCGTTGSDLCANRWPHGMDGISIYRKDLDPFLADLAVKAGAELRTSTLVNDVIMENGQVRGVKTEKGESILAEVVIAADGAMSTMAKKSGMRDRWGGGCTLVPQLDFGCNADKMDDIIGNAEWCWFGPLYGTYQVNFRDGFHIGAGQWLRSDWDEKPLEMMKKVVKIPGFQAMCRAVEAKPREYQAHMLPWLKKPPKTYTGGMMLVGDAAGFPCPLEAEGIWHAITSGKIAAETAAWAISRGDASEKALAEYERRWKASDLGKEHEFGPEFVDLWNSSIFDPKLMARQIQLLLEFSMLHPFSIVFDWGDAHMDCFNQHLEHILDLAPEFSEFGKTYVAPLARGIWPKNVKRILLKVKPKIPALRRLSDENFFKVVARLSKGLAPYLDPSIRQDAPVPRDVFERGVRK